MRALSSDSGWLMRLSRLERGCRLWNSPGGTTQGRDPSLPLPPQIPDTWLGARIRNSFSESNCRTDRAIFSTKKSQSEGVQTISSQSASLMSTKIPGLLQNTEIIRIQGSSKASQIVKNEGR